MRKLRLSGRAALQMILWAVLLQGMVCPVFAGASICTQVDIPVTYIAADGGAADAAMQTFRLSPEGEDTPMPEGTSQGVKTIRMPSSGEAHFGAMTYTRPDVYRYRVSRVMEKGAGRNRQEEAYEVKVIITGTGGSSLVVNRASDGEKSALIFSDQVSLKAAEKTPPQTGDTALPNLMGAAFSTSAAVLLFLLSGRKHRTAERKIV